jgi:hypothetical protein
MQSSTQFFLLLSKAKRIVWAHPKEEALKEESKTSIVARSKIFHQGSKALPVNATAAKSFS